MTAEIRLEVASLEHMTKQPKDMRYALFCWEALTDTRGLSCEAQRRGGHIGDFAVYAAAKQNGLDHAHSVLVRFYPDSDNSIPSEDFSEDLRSLPTDYRVL